MFGKIKKATENEINLLLQRPSNYFKLSNEEQWDIDKSLGILDLEVTLTKSQQQKLNKHFGL